ncbi:MAG: hypothetical protein ABI690_18230 [Chloroflexota bacterium]
MAALKQRSIMWVSGISVLMIVVLMGVGTASAQRPGGGRPTPSGSGGDTSGSTKPTREAPVFATPAATLVLPAGGGNFPTLQGTLTLPSSIPTLQIPTGSSEAEAAISNFGSMYLGIQQHLLYAGDLTDSLNSASGKSGSTGEASLQASLDQLPSELQGFLTSAESMSGAMYWGVWQTGSAAVAVGDCTDNPNCTITIDNLNVYLTQSSGGLYMTYTKSAPASSSDALNLILATYPGLNGLTFDPGSYTSTGYAFQSNVVKLGSTSTIEIVYTGVVNSGGQSLVYAWVAVGEGYVGIVGK